MADKRLVAPDHLEPNIPEPTALRLLDAYCNCARDRPHELERLRAACAKIEWTIENERTSGSFDIFLPSFVDRPKGEVLCERSVTWVFEPLVRNCDVGWFRIARHEERDSRRGVFTHAGHK